MKFYGYDAEFLKKLDEQENKQDFLQVLLLDLDENVIKSLDAYALPGSSITINGDSSVRRTGTLNMFIEAAENDLTNLEHMFAMNKKIKILKGISNSVDTVNYEPVIWFNLGIFLIDNPSISHTATGVTVNLNIKDKMCMLNGDAGGTFPATVSLSSTYITIGGRLCEGDPTTGAAALPFEDLDTHTVYYWDDNGETKYKMWNDETGWEDSSEGEIGQVAIFKPSLYEIIQTIVCNFGGEDIGKIYISDVDIKKKQAVYFLPTSNSSSVLYVKEYVDTDDEDKVKYTYTLEDKSEDPDYKPYYANDSVGYKYIDYTYPDKDGKSLIASPNSTVVSLLDTIKTEVFPNHEYYYDINGNFIFQEKRNYLNTSFDPTAVGNDLGDYSKYRLESRFQSKEINNMTVLDNCNYNIDYNNTGSVYIFGNNDKKIISITNNLNYSNIRNDYHIWGAEDCSLHYHVAIKEKPILDGTGYPIKWLKDDDDNIYGMTINYDNPDVESYVPEDWRIKLYLEGRVKEYLNQRPDLYEQEIIDNLDSDLYDFENKKFILDDCIRYWIDYLEPTKNVYNSNIFNYSVENIGTRIYGSDTNTAKQIIKMYDLNDVPDCILIGSSYTGESKSYFEDMCDNLGQRYFETDETLDNNLVTAVAGYSCADIARTALYEHTGFNESISITCLPIYYLEPNTRITVRDIATGIDGDYIINSISLPLDASSAMTISASKALQRL